MLSLELIFKSQARYGVGTSARKVETVPYIGYLTDVRRYLSDKTPEGFYNWEAKRQDDFTRKCIVEYIQKHSYMVDGFVGANGELKIEDLVSKLIEDIIDSGILKYALENPDVQEIQINDCKTIFVTVKGRSVPYCDSNGNLLQFANDAELCSAIDRLIYDKEGNTSRITKTNPILNARTVKHGFRIAAVGNSAITRDINPLYNFPITSCTLRKHSDTVYDFSDFLKWGSMTPRMAKLLSLIAMADLKVFFVGRTSSGKTTVLNAVLHKLLERNPAKRIIAIQNPTEIMLYKRSPETSANLWNVLHWEAIEVGIELAKNPTVNTMKNLLASALRNSPDIIVPGEMRLAEEFNEVFKALKYDQRVLSTFHASDGNDAIWRWASELSSLGGSPEDFLKPLSNSIDFIVSQNYLDDGRRRVTGIEEITGRVIDGVVETRKIAEFTFTGETKFDKNGRVEEVCGYYTDNKIKLSEAIRQKFYKAGITKEELDEF